MECFHFSEQRFPHICLKKVPIVSVQDFILSVPDYHHINFQRFPHFSITVPFFNGERVLGVACRSGHDILLCVWLLQMITNQLPLMLSCWFSTDLLMILFFVSPLYTGPYERFNSYTPGQLFGINLLVFLHQIFFNPILVGMGGGGGLWSPPL